MTSRQLILTIFLASIAGFWGGFFSSQVLKAQSAFAENKENYEKVLKAGIFELVSEDGRTHARLYLSNKGPVFTMRDWGGSTAELWAGQFGGMSTAGLSLTSPKNESIRLSASDLETTIFSSKTDR
jgi:hypothetical protein